MVGTVRAARFSAGTALTVGLLLGSCATLVALGAVGALLHPPRALLLAAAAACVLAAVVDVRGARVRPQNRLQVPERWRRTMPLPVAALLYGLLLGTGVVGAVPAAAVWAVLLVVVALGSPLTALAVGVALGVGRALPVLAFASADAISERPTSLRVVRALGACAVAAAAVAAFAGSSSAATVAAVQDPSAVEGELAWQQPGVGGFLRTATETKQLPGTHPAIGGALIAWRVEDQVTVATRATLVPLFEEQIVGARELAVSDTWLVMRTLDASGASRLIAQSIADTNVHKVIASVKPPSVVGRPSISGTTVVFATSTPRGSWISSVDLATDNVRRLRTSTSSQLLNPSLEGSELLYVQSSRCFQQLRLEPLDRKGGRALLTLPPVAGADIGHERGHTSQGTLTPCPRRIRPSTSVLWTTALGPHAAFVTTLRQRPGSPTVPTLLELPR
jgi:hypothetical protein